MDAVRAGKDALAPGAQEIAVPVKHDHRVFAAVKGIDMVVVIDGDGGDIVEAPAIRQLRPVIMDLVTVLAFTEDGAGHGGVSFWLAASFGVGRILPAFFPASLRVRGTRAKQSIGGLAGTQCLWVAASPAGASQ
jgi:hypothetical protein